MHAQTRRLSHDYETAALRRRSTRPAATAAGRTRTSLKATRTEQILEHLESEGDGLGAGAAGTLAGLRALDARWEAMRRPTAAPPATPFVTEASVEAEPAFDVVVLGGTLGIFAAEAPSRPGV